MSRVIRSDSFGLDDGIRDLLEKSMITMSQKQVAAWMETLYDPAHMFVMIRDDRPVSCLQMETRILRLKDRQMTVSVPVLFCTHPDYRLQRCFGKLLDAAISQACLNDLALLAVTDQVKILEKRTFVPVARCREYWLDRTQIPPIQSGSVYPWRGEDLYALYVTFLENFPVRIQLDRTAFDRYMAYLKKSGRKISVAFDHWHRPEGFAVSSTSDSWSRFELVVYDNSRALMNLLARQARFSQTVVVETGPNEALERLFEAVSHRPRKSVMVRMTNWQLMSRWLDQEIRNPRDLFNAFPDAMWFGMLSVA